MQAPGSLAATRWLVACTLAYAAAPDSCIKEKVPEWFLPVRSDVSCARSILGAIPGEVSRRDVEVADELAGVSNLTWQALQRSSFYQHDQNFGGRLWRSQFGNQFFFWIELAGGTALCSALDQQSPKIFGEKYCREEIRGGPESPAHRQQHRVALVGSVRSRDRDDPRGVDARGLPCHERHGRSR